MRIEMYTKGLSFYFFWSYAHFDMSDSNSENIKKVENSDHFVLTEMLAGGKSY